MKVPQRHSFCQSLLLFFHDPCYGIMGLLAPTKKPISLFCPRRWDCFLKVVLVLILGPCLHLYLNVIFPNPKIASSILRITLSTLKSCPPPTNALSLSYHLNSEMVMSALSIYEQYHFNYSSSRSTAESSRVL